MSRTAGCGDWVISFVSAECKPSRHANDFFKFPELIGSYWQSSIKVLEFVGEPLVSLVHLRNRLSNFVLYYTDLYFKNFYCEQFFGIFFKKLFFVCSFW